MTALNSLGLRIRAEFNRPEKSWIDRARAIPVAVIGDCAQRLQALPAGFNHYGGRQQFAGPALTVRVRPGDNLFLHKALDLAQPGDVIMVDADGATRSAIIGAMMTNYAKTRHIEALVVDGAIRDVKELAQIDLSVLARGATPNGPFKSGPGEIGQSISCGGISIAAGDLIVGDEDGALVIPLADIETVILAAKEKHRLEQSWEKQIASGTWDRGWVDEALAKL